MLFALLALGFITLLLVLALLLRKSAASTDTVDPRLEQLLAADLPSQLTRLDARSAALDQHLRSELAQMRNDAAAEATRSRTELLANISTLGDTLRSGLEAFRTDNTQAAEHLRSAVDAQLKTITERFTSFTSDTTRHHAESRETLQKRLDQLGTDQTSHQEKLRASVEAGLTKINQDNTAQLEQMRQTVDEKLHATLQTRLTESFGQVTEQLTRVHSGLGEMTKLSAGVDDLSRIFTNVKSRGGFAEVQLGILLQQMLAPSQFQQNVRVKPETQEVVEYAVKFPTPNGETLLPIDAKFPREAWERLETAYATGADILSAGKAFETAIRTEGKRICEKYIAPPVTTSFAVMFLPTEGLYAEVMRRDGLQSDIQQNCRVTIAGPSTLSAILSSFQMGFHMLQMQEKGDEVWKVLAGAQKEFGNLGILMAKMEKQVDTVQNTIQEVGRRSRKITRTLNEARLENGEASLPAGSPGAFDGLLPMLAASDDE